MLVGLYLTSQAQDVTNTVPVVKQEPAASAAVASAAAGAAPCTPPQGCAASAASAAPATPPQGFAAPATPPHGCAAPANPPQGCFATAASAAEIAGAGAAPATQLQICAENQHLGCVTSVLQSLRDLTSSPVPWN